MARERKSENKTGGIVGRDEEEAKSVGSVSCDPSYTRWSRPVHGEYCDSDWRVNASDARCNNRHCVRLCVMANCMRFGAEFRDYRLVSTFMQTATAREQAISYGYIWAS